jgi:hypothetical protein
MASVDELLPPSAHFTLSLAEKVRARGGLPEHLWRLGLIERLIGRCLGELREAADPRRLAATLDLQRLNQLIDKHNRYYPIEANLPIDPRNGGPRGFRPMDAVTPDWLLARI